MQISRRGLIGGAATTLAFAGFARLAWSQEDPPQTVAANRALPYQSQIPGYGPLVDDPAGIFDLPAGFSYQVVSRAGETMSDGLLVPHKHDGMAAFAGPGEGLVSLVRNHEVTPAELDLGAFGPNRALAARTPRGKFYDTTPDGLPLPGGTTTLVYDTRAKRLVSHHLSLAGTSTNCAGGPTPRNTWLSCEETTLKRGQVGRRDHGYVFEVPAAGAGIVDPWPIMDMGRFRHEATATDPRTGIVYLTEDVGDGFGLFYRYLPNDRNRLLAGGRLQALGFAEGAEADPRNWIVGRPFMQPGASKPVRWINLTGVTSPDDDLRDRGHAAGAAWFARGEGIYFGSGELFFACTSGGPERLGQIFRYIPSAHEGQTSEAEDPGRLQLFIEPRDPNLMNMCDNIAVSPWGHLYVCEDKGQGVNFLKAVTPQGQVYTVARSPLPSSRSTAVNSELCGVCFSPDGSTLFVNIQWPGYTIAVTGPWSSLRP